jgi:hypothetical protein
MSIQELNETQRSQETGKGTKDKTNVARRLELEQSVIGELGYPTVNETPRRDTCSAGYRDSALHYAHLQLGSIPAQGLFGQQSESCQEMAICMAGWLSWVRGVEE